MTMTIEKEADGRVNAGPPVKYLTFLLGNEFYGIPVLTVREIMRMSGITAAPAIPGMPAYARGVINLRGKIIPIADLRIRFGLPAETSEKTCIIVVRAQLAGGQAQIGLIVDEVEEVAQIGGADIEAAPDFGNGVDTRFITGMAKIGGRVKTLLDIDKVIGSEVITGF